MKLGGKVEALCDVCRGLHTWTVTGLYGPRVLLEREHDTLKCNILRQVVPVAFVKGDNA